MKKLLRENLEELLAQIARTSCTIYSYFHGREYPVNLKQTHLENAQILPHRNVMLDHLEKRGHVAEIGVSEGKFAEKILQKCDPEKLHLIDRWASTRGRNTLKNVKSKFDTPITSGRVQLHRGNSTEMLRQMKDNYFDWVYIDTDHTYETTRNELKLSKRKVKEGGVIAGDDYTIGNYWNFRKYGVIRAVNEFCISEDWNVIYLTNESHRYLSYALQRPQT